MSLNSRQEPELNVTEPQKELLTGSRLEGKVGLSLPGRPHPLCDCCPLGIDLMSGVMRPPYSAPILKESPSALL